MDGRELRLNSGTYVLGTTIGSGRFGKVKVASRARDGKPVALKITDPLEARKNFSREVAALQRLSDQPGIAEYIDHGEGVLYPKTRGRTAVMRDIIALSLAKNGELYPFLMINEEPCPLPEPIARALFLQLLQSLENMHNCKVAHRDIKLQNLLLDDDYNLILTDFGLASPVASPKDNLSPLSPQSQSGGWDMEPEDNNGSSKQPASSSDTHSSSNSDAASMQPVASGNNGSDSLETVAVESKEEGEVSLQLHSIVGTRGHQAPEVLQHKPYNGYKADIWSVGVVLFNFVTAAPPYEHSRDWWFRALATARDRFWLQHRKFMSTQISEECQDLLDKMLTLDPEKRMDIEGIKSHPWFEKAPASQEVVRTELERRNEALRSGVSPTKDDEDGFDIDVFSQDVARSLPSITVKLLEDATTDEDDFVNTEEGEGPGPGSAGALAVYVASGPPMLPKQLAPSMFTRSLLTGLKPLAIAQAIVDTFTEFQLTLADDCESFHFRGYTNKSARLNIRVFELPSSKAPYLVAHLGGVPASSEEFRLHLRAWRSLAGKLRQATVLT